MGADVLHGVGGRLRLGWRLLAWAAAAVALLLAVAATVPARGIPWVSLPLLVAGLGAGWLLLAVEGRPLGDLGFPLERGAFGASARGLALGLAVGLAAVAAMAGAGGVRWIGDGGGAGAWLGAGALALWSLALPAAAEEALLRGYPLQALAEAWGPAPALAITSLAFALLHLDNPALGAVGLANLAVAGVFLGAVVLRTGSLWCASGAHLGWNWAHAFLADMPVSGFDLVDAPLLDAVPLGPAWVSGGPFGPEGSVVATAVLAAAAFWTWRSPRLSTDGGRWWASGGSGPSRP